MNEQNKSPVQPDVAQPVAVELGPAGHQPVASYIHTGIVVCVMLLWGYSSSQSAGQFRSGNVVSTYLTTIVLQWILFGVVLLGVKLRGLSLDAVLGRPWKRFDDFLHDLIIAGAFWIGFAILVILINVIVHQGMPKTDVKEALRGIEGIVPRTMNQFMLWIGLSATAGIVEEFVFRGYLQRQFTALTQRVWLGILIPSAIFLVGHLYQGEKALMTGVLGIAFGILAAWTRNLRPGIMAHMWQNIFSGAVSMILLRNPELMTR